MFAIENMKLQIEAKDGVNWLRNNCEAAYSLLKKFIENHGHRSLKEV